ncbi:MAG: BatD family protein [Campylobacterota bacterium]|nr:BatD family protein [Campylobacterota bacterium]
MKNLGKIFLITILFALSLHAELKVNVSATDVTIGERVTLNVTVAGENSAPPNLTSICGEAIVSSSKRTSVQGINGVFTKKEVYEYIFIPTTSCIIEPITVNIDGNDEISKPIKINVTAMKVTKDSPFVLTLKSDKKKIHVGEPFKLTVVFRQKNGSKAVDSKFALPEMKNFWVKEESVGRKYENDGFTTQELTYILAAQKSGYHTIAPARIEIATRSNKRDSWGQWFAALNWRSYFSNDLELEVLPLPSGINVVGNFKISATPDVNEVNATEAVNVTVRISGSGNFEDIKAYNPKLKGVGVFEEEPIVNAAIKDGKYVGMWSQKIVYVPNESITIAPFVLEYFDLTTNSVRAIQTKPIKIHVKNAIPAKKEPLKIERAQVKESVVTQQATPEDDNGSFILGLLFGLFGGAILGLLPWRVWLKREDINTASYKNERDVLTLLLNHLDDDEALKMVDKLEAKLYGGQTIHIDKRELKVLFKRFSK